MPQQIKKTLRIVLPLLFGAAIIIFAYYRFTPEQIEEIKRQVGAVDYSWIGLGLLLTLLSHLSRAWRWRYMLDAVGAKKDYLSCVTAIGAGYAMNLLIPRSGEVARAVIARDRLGITVEKALGTIIGERILDFLILILITLTALGLATDELLGFFSGVFDNAFAKANTRKIIYLSIVAAIILITGIVLVYYLKPVKKIKNFLEGIKEGLMTIYTMKSKWYYLLHTVFIWVMYLLMFYVCFFALPSISTVPVTGILAAFVAGSFAVAFTNGGFGAYPFLVAQVLVLFGVEETSGTAFGWVVWLAQTVLVFCYGITSFAIISLKPAPSTEKS